VYTKHLLKAVYSALSVFCTVANGLESRSGPTCVGPDLDSSLFASSTAVSFKNIYILQKINFFKMVQTDFYSC